MHRGALIANGLVLLGIAWLGALGPQQHASALLPPGSAASELAHMAALEDRAARSSDAGSTTALASAYLDRNQPGLATAVLDRAPSAVRERPEVTQLYARALFARGRVREALAAAQSIAGSCESPGDATCPAWLIARSTRQVAFLEEVVAAGIDDPASDPRATMAAYERSAREVRIVAMR